MCGFSELCRINEHQKVALDLDPYVKKLLNARRRVVLVNNILQNAQVSDQSVADLLLYHVLPVSMPTIRCTAFVTSDIRQEISIM